MKTTKIDLCSLPKNVRETTIRTVKGIKLISAQVEQKSNSVHIYRLIGKTRTQKCYVEVTATGQVITVKFRQNLDVNKQIEAVPVPIELASFVHPRKGNGQTL